MQRELFEQFDDEKVICGTDEAGRGPLAGPVVAAAVILPHDFPVEILNDSKKMSEKERIKVEAIIKEKATAWAVSAISHKIIDKINILNSSLLGMKRSYEKIRDDGYKITILLCDGNKTPDVDCPVEAIVKGDAKVPEIMAASILAKNHRDRLMDRADKKWPQYGFAHHKGYPTKEHYEALKKYGPCPIHRLSFRLEDKKTKRDEELF
ncbi:MAG: ribonuclease HII [Spirochaetales bacterium]|nr:ribonuclease HII [Spirochaetales bacterium]